MFSTVLAGLAVVISLQALRLAARDRIVISVLPETGPAESKRLPELPHFISQLPEKPERKAEIAFETCRPMDIHPN